MTVADLEREMFDAPLEPGERALGGLVLAVGVAGHVLLGVTAALFLYVLLLTLGA
ncbi:hypothetical protein [Halomarina pelagica]|uniref:hypothetical protein n=1 Tax=Halomarina pelagica TaxID=2961599 RepID=UPI0020C38B87|nr:hypothetical protein [Halomarina sp. BND7]